MAPSEKEISTPVEEFTGGNTIVETGTLTEEDVIQALRPKLPWEGMTPFIT